jgi:hypothetical protein
MADIEEFSNAMKSGKATDKKCWLNQTKIMLLK